MQKTLDTRTKLLTKSPFPLFFQFWICGVGLQSLPDAAADMGLQNLLIGAFEQSLGCHCVFVCSC